MSYRVEGCPRSNSKDGSAEFPSDSDINSFTFRKHNNNNPINHILYNMFYEGDLQSGIARAVQESKSVLCFVNGVFT